MTAFKTSLLILLASVAAFGASPSPAAAEEIFVSPGGLERAQRAVRARTATMRSDIVVNLRGGTYRLREPLRFTARDSGQNGHRVIYRAHRGERVVISGGRRITGWRRAGHGAWRADVGDLETRQLYVDGRRARRTALGRGLPGKPIQLRTGYAVRSTVPQSWRRPRDMELVFNGAEGGLPYSEARCGVARIRGDAKWSVVDLDQPCWSRLKKAYRAEVEGLSPPAPTDVENSLSFLRRPGSWYLDRSRPGRHVLYYRGKDPRRAAVVAPVLQRLLVGSRVHDVTFSGLTFSHATWLAPSRRSGFPQIIGSWTYSGRMPGQVAFHGAERVSIEDSRFTHLGGVALVLSRAGAGNAVRGNVIGDVSGGGVELRGPGAGNRVEDNRVHRIGREYRSSIGIAVEGSPETTVAHNQVDHVPYTGIWGQAPRGLRVEGNLVSDAVRAVPDGGGIYLPYAQGTSFEDGAVVRGNVVRRAGGTGIYPDVGADWVTLDGNVLYGSDEAVSGVEPKTIRITGNHWDDDTPFWWPEDTPTDGITLAGNALLRADDPAASCRADAACRAVVEGAGVRP